MGLFSVLGFFGGLSLFLYGMKTMGQDLKAVSGGRMQGLINKMCSNTFKSILLGALVTALIQSSTASTVIIIGLVNSGILSLYQAAGAIMGANVGTTITSWLLSTTGIESDNIFLKLLKPSGLAPIIAVTALVFFVMKNNERNRTVSGILFGFSILLFGMEMMSSAVKPLAQNEKFISILTLFSNPLFGIIAGFVLTAIIQSSSASIGILQALSVTGAFTYGSAIPIVLGQNIGTCVTTLLSGLGADKNAKRASLIHLYFNIVGSAVVMILFYGVHAIIGFKFIDSVVNASDIALIHTAFNLLSLAILLPFIKLLTKLAVISVKDSGEESKNDLPIATDFSEGVTVYNSNMLDTRFFASPTFALEISKYSLERMGELSRKNLEIALELVDKFDKKLYDTVCENENLVDRYEADLSTYVVKLASYNLTARENTEITKIIHSISDVERIADYAKSVATSAEKIDTILRKRGDEPEPGVMADISVLFDAVKTCVSEAATLISGSEASDAKKIISFETFITDLCREIRTRNEIRNQKGKPMSELALIISDIINSCERIAAHSAGVASAVIKSFDFEYDIHGYHKAVRDNIASNNDEAYDHYRKMFVLPAEI